MTTTEVRIRRDVEIPMRDGAVLLADVYTAGATAKPALVQRTPYNKSLVVPAHVYGGVEPMTALDAGYSLVIQDTRGRWASGGSFDPFTHEAEDGEDTIAWVQEQPWCDGKCVGYGMSYAGATQLLAATTGAPGLAAVAPALTASEYYDGWTYQGGAFQLGFALLWTLTDLAPAEALRREDLSTQQKQHVLATLQTMADDLDAGYRVLPAEQPAEFVESAPWYRRWLEHPCRDDYWRATAVSDRYHLVGVPGLHIGGWYDIFLGGTLRNYVGLRDGARGKYARRNQRLIVGPWAHGNLSADVGDASFGVRASQAALDITRIQLDFFDDVLAGRDVALPPVQLFVMGRNRWQAEDSWPPNDAESATFYLHGGVCSPEKSDRRSRVGGLRPTAAPNDDLPSSYLYDPLDPSPTLGGPTFLPGLLANRNLGPRDHRPTFARDDQVLFVSDPLETELEVIGPVSVTLWAASSGEDADFVARLLDVRSDGRAMLLCEGIVRARHREGLDAARPLAPNTPMQLDIDLIATANVFAAGHRIGLAITSSSFPRFDRNPSTIKTLLEQKPDDLQGARQTIFHDGERASRIQLTVRRR